MNTRREFLGWMAGAAAVAGTSRAASRHGGQAEGRPYTDKIEVPKVLDHILLGCGDLERGIAFVEERTGVRAAFGGVHPGRGTQNALLSLGTRRYLEIIAPDPKQAALRDAQSSVERLKLRELAEPKLVTWAAHPGEIAALAEKLAKAGVAAEGPTPGSRKRPDGHMLQWKTLNLKEDLGGVLPFFIEWSAESLHPSVDAPKGCELEKFWVESPAPDELAKKFEAIGVAVRTMQGERVRLRARIAGTKGEMELSG
jgi:hypothetical protein